MVASWLAVCVTYRQGLAIIFWGHGDYPEFLLYGIQIWPADFIVLVDFLHVLGSIEGRFISAPNSFEQMLGLFCCDYTFVDPSWDILRLDMFGMRWCVFVNKGGQSGGHCL